MIFWSFLVLGATVASWLVSSTCVYAYVVIFKQSVVDDLKQSAALLFFFLGSVVASFVVALLDSMY
jgi:hypothetical protein